MKKDYTPDMLRDLNDALNELELCRAVLKDYSRGIRGVEQTAAAVRRIEVAGQVADNIRATITKTEGE